MSQHDDYVLSELQREEGFCCLIDCCGPGSWCCAHCHPHEHPELDEEGGL